MKLHDTAHLGLGIPPGADGFLLILIGMVVLLTFALITWLILRDSQNTPRITASRILNLVQILQTEVTNLEVALTEVGQQAYEVRGWFGETVQQDLFVLKIETRPNGKCQITITLNGKTSSCGTSDQEITQLVEEISYRARIHRLAIRALPVIASN